MIKTIKHPDVDKNEREFVFGKIKVQASNFNKLYWPKEGITKGMVIEYYQAMAKYILPYLKGRPESLKRNPGGIMDKGFFHKDAGEDAPSWVDTIKIYSEFSDKEIEYIICNNEATLAYLNNLGCIEINPWSSMAKSLDKPDYMIIDIDPSSKNTFAQVIETAIVFKGLLDKAGATAYCKTSGATGLHIYVPMAKRYDYEQVKNFAEVLCTLVNEQLPKFTSMERSLSKRGNNDIYLDYLQNRRGQTIACAYSLRPVKGATVSTPLHWKEVKQGLEPAMFDINNTLKRVNKQGDLFFDVLGAGIDLKKCIKKLSS
jgi:bifunctional non-homologous end joining protein LigD